MEEDIQEVDELFYIKRAQSGDGDAISYLLETYKSMVRALSRPLFLIDGEQDDLIQEGMIGLFKAIQAFDQTQGASFETFANLCISRQLYSAIKMSNRLKNQPLNSYISIYSPEGEGLSDEQDHSISLENNISEWQRNPEEIIIARETKRNIMEKINQQLSKMESQVLDLFLAGLTYQEIAATLNKSPKSIDNALQRIRNKFEKIIT